MAATTQLNRDELAALGDAELLWLVAIGDAYGAHAFAEFHRRYATKLYTACVRICDRFCRGNQRAQELFCATLARAHDRANTYKAGVSSEGSTEQTRTLSWLYRIAENILYDWLRNPSRPGPLNETADDRHVEDYGTEDFASLMADRFSAKDNVARRQALALGFETILSPREQRVLMTTNLYRTYSPKGTYMQRGKASEMAASLGTSAPNLRKIRQRAIAKLSQFVDEAFATKSGDI
jgi:RNA polymerase sigma factor (sigma-70 family)